MNIIAGKQVGPIYYMVNNVEVLALIVKQNAIRTSLKAEPQSKGGNKYHYVSFMRDLTKVNRNPNRWIYGVRIDGDKLSDRYSINPYSYASVAMKGNFYRVKTLTAYDNETYTLSVVNWPTMVITKEIFNTIQEMILSDSQNLNKIKQLQIKEGSRKYRGKQIVIQYNYNVKSGGIVLNETTLPASILSYLLKHSNMNETEERIWIVDDATKFINISGCITGYIAPKGDESIDAAIDSGLLPSNKVIYY